MTAPAPSTPQPPQVPPGWEVLARDALILLALEQAAHAVFGPLRAQLRALARSITAEWVRQFGTLDAPSDPIGLHQVTAVALGELHRLDTAGLADRVTATVERALETGVQQSTDLVAPARRPARSEDARPVTYTPGAGHMVAERVVAVKRDLDVGRITLDPVIRGELDRLDGSMRDLITDAADTARRLGEHAKWPDAARVIAMAGRAATGGERIAAWTVNAAANQGAREVAARLGVERVWIAERNACRVCLALSGHVSKDGAFDSGLTFGAGPMPVWPAGPLYGPPRHGNCRCRAEPWMGSVPGYTGTDLPAALKREAQRSILTGWRLGSESESVRLDAARRLLARGTGLPKSVRARAQSAVAHGSFGPFPRTHLRRTTGKAPP